MVTITKTILGYKRHTVYIADPKFFVYCNNDQQN